MGRYSLRSPTRSAIADSSMRNKARKLRLTCYRRAMETPQAAVKAVIGGAI
jgi:hypothetical protein